MIREDEYVRVWSCKCGSNFTTPIRKVADDCPNCGGTISDKSVDLKGFKSNEGAFKSLDDMCDHSGYACDCCTKVDCECRVDEYEPHPHDIYGCIYEWDVDGKYCIFCGQRQLRIE